MYTNYTGINNAAEYMASGWPWMSTSIGLSTSSNTITLPYISNELYFCCSSGSARVGFTANGVNTNNYFLVANNELVTFKIRCTKIYIRSDSGSATLSVGASLTNISGRSMPVLSSSYANPNDDGRVDPTIVASSSIPVFGYTGV